jgi:hypothetical protein
MATITLTPQTLSVCFSRGEKVAGLLRSQRVPVSAVVRAEVVPDGLTAARGMRSPGLGVPGRRRVGTWRGLHGKRLICVRAGQPALRVSLTGQSWTEMLLDVDAPEQVAASLAACR